MPLPAILQYVPDQLIDGVSEIVDERDIEMVASSPPAPVDEVADLPFDSNRFLIARSMINDRITDHEEGIQWMKSAAPLFQEVRERRERASESERKKRLEGRESRTGSGKDEGQSTTSGVAGRPRNPDASRRPKVNNRRSSR